MAVSTTPLLLSVAMVLTVVAKVSADPANLAVTEENSVADDTPKTLVKRNVAWIARSGHRKFFFPPRYQKRNMAWFARSGGRDASYFPSSPKRSMDEEVAFEQPYGDEDLDYLSEDDFIDKRNLASLVNSKNVPSFVSAYKRHVGSALRYLDSEPSMYHSPQKRFFASLLKSETPPPSIYARMNRRLSYFNEPPRKRFFSSLLDNDYDVPEDEIEKRHFASVLDSDTPYEGKRSFSSLLKSENGIGMAGKRYYSSLLDNTKDEDKRYVASLLKSTALEDADKSPSDQLLGSIYDRQGAGLDKRTFSSLLNRKNPYEAEKHIAKRHIGSLRDSSKRFYGSILDNSPNADLYDKRSFNSLLKSSSYQQPDKKHVGAALRYRPGKRDSDLGRTEEELELDDLEKRFVGSLLDDTPAKRHLASLLDSRDARGGYLYGAEPYPVLNQEEKRYIASLLDNRPALAKRFIGSLMDSDSPPSFNKRYLGSALRYKNEGKRFVGSTINSRMNFLNSKGDDDKRYIGSIVQSKHNNDIQEGKRFYASVLDNTPAASVAGSNNDDKRFVGSALKSKVSGDVRSKRGAGDKETTNRQKRSIALGAASAPGSEDGNHLAFLDGSDGNIAPVKRFLPRMARQNWFPEFY